MAVIIKNNPGMNLPTRSASSQPTVSTQVRSRTLEPNPALPMSSRASGLMSYFAHLTVTRSRPLPELTGLRVHLLMVALLPAPVEPMQITQFGSSSPSSSTNVNSSSTSLIRSEAKSFEAVEAVVELMLPLLEAAVTGAMVAVVLVT